MSFSKLAALPRFRTICAALAATFGFAVADTYAQPPQQESQGAVPDRILIKPQKELPEAALRALAEAHGLEQKEEIAPIGVRVMSVPAERRETVLEALNRNPNIEFAEPDYEVQLLLTPNDPRYGEQWHLPKIQAPAAWDVTTGIADQVIAIIDTGVNSNHPDLKAKMLPGYNFISDNTNAGDDHGHGTLVAGAAAAIGNNGEGVAGVAWKNWILPIKSLDSSGGGSHSSIANGITYAADNGARVINLSLGSSVGSRTLENAVNYAWKKNCVIVAAAGNSGDSTPTYPATYANVIGVSALDSSDQLPSWATYGEHVSLSAPGVSILSTTRGGGYGASSGSSFASPLVAGAAGAVLAVAPSLSNSDVVKNLESTSDDLGVAGYDIYFGHGRLNTEAAVLKAGGSNSADTAAPSVAIVSPKDGATLSGTADIEIDSYDDVGVEKVELYLNGNLVAESSQQVVTFRWDTTQSADGKYTLQARASDAAGNVGSSNQIDVTVVNQADESAPASPLSVTITSPKEGSRIWKMTKVDVEAQGGDGIERLELYIDGSLYASSTSSSATFNWNVNRQASGDYKLQALAYDSAGQVEYSEIVTVTK